MKRPFIQLRALAAGVLAAFSLVACGGGSGTPAPPPPPPPPPAATGTLSIAITNRTACDLEAVNVTISKFRFNKAPRANEVPVNGWVDVPVIPARKINLLNLTNGALEILGQATLEAGHYNWMGMYLDTGTMAHTVVPSAGDAEQALELPIWPQGEGYIFAGFDVVAGEKTSIVFDGNGCRSAEASADGKRYFPPISLVTSASNGIKGFVSPDALGKHVLVTAQWRRYFNWIVASTKPDPVTGEFWLSHLEADDYDVVITADNSAATLIGKVPVSATATTAISTRASPIPLAPSSKSGSISGTLTFSSIPRNGAQAYLSANQQFAPDLIATVQYKPADVATDTFTLANLPLAPPQYAYYSSVLPLTFTASSTATAGTYTVLASASGRLTNAVQGVDISKGDKTGVNLVLIPSGP